MIETLCVDNLVFGAGMYGLFAARHLAAKGRTIAVVEFDEAPFQRASFINQARLHNGYHYPRSYSTAIKSATFFERFNAEFNVAVNDSFRQIYAIAKTYSYTSGEQFLKFCQNAKIPCKPIRKEEYFQSDMIDGAYETLEYSYDAEIIKDFLLEEIKNSKGKIKFLFGRFPVHADISKGEYEIELNDGNRIKTSEVLNATYGSVNQINSLFGFEVFKIKYEICEIILGYVSKNMINIGITLMDGPFFSIMPFGKTGLHSLTSVTFTPHKTCFDSLPKFTCQEINNNCSTEILKNCNNCPAKPISADLYMMQLARKYLRSNIEYHYERSLFSMKPILASSELDDSRPTLIRILSESPRFISVLSGKINTVYDLEEVL